MKSMDLYYPPPKPRISKPKVSPRSLRVLCYQDKSIVLGAVPEPPPEWNSTRRKSMKRALKASVMFVRSGYRYDHIKKEMSLGDITKQRLFQILEKGCRFLVERGCFTRADNGKTIELPPANGRRK